MKVAPKVIFLFEDPDGFATSILNALQPDPRSHLRRLEESFELSLERYDIEDCKASGSLVHFIDPNGFYEVSILLMQKYEPPVLACAVNEILVSISWETLSEKPKLILPIIVPASKIKFEGSSKMGCKVSLYSVHVGSEKDMHQGIASKIPKPLSSLQIHHEPLSCFIHFVRVLKLPTCVLFGLTNHHRHNDISGEELKVIYELGEALASISSMCFLEEKFEWQPTQTSRNNEEPWRALYG